VRQEPKTSQQSRRGVEMPAVRRLSLAVGIALAAVSASAPAVPIWVNPGTGNWFTAANWSPAAVPVAGDAVIVSNGGTAQLAGE